MEKVRKTDAEWRVLLSPEEFYVTREKGTERAFTGRYPDTAPPGIYGCVACGTVLFALDTKFDAGCGWPGYYEALGADRVREKRDIRQGMIRTEVLCNVCDSHLGHVFPDGRPLPAAVIAPRRYCTNSPALKFEPAKE